MKILKNCSLILIVLSLFYILLCACKNNNSENLQTPISAKQSEVTKGLYVHEKNDYSAWSWIKIEDNNKFVLNRGVGLSYLPEGKYEVDGDKMFLKTEDLGIYEFQISDDTLIYIKSEDKTLDSEMVFIYTNKSLEDINNAID